jgi:hypothetical protein
MIDRTRLFALSLVLVLASCATSEEVRPGAALRLELFDGNGQIVGTEDVSSPMTVRVVDPDDSAVPGVEVTWRVKGGHGVVTPATDTTGVIGTSSVTYRTTDETGVDTIVAHLGTTDSLAFVVTVVAPGSSTRDHLYFRTGNGFAEDVAVNDTSIAFGIVVLDTLHAPIPGLEVRWSMLSGPGSVIAADTTNAAGIALTRYFATADTGDRRVMARIGADSVLFFLHVAPPCAVGTLAVGQAIDSVMPGPACDQGEFKITLAAGQAYFLRETHHPDPAHNNIDLVDPVLSLWQAFDDRPVRADRSAHLAFSDDDGGELNSELFFTAPAGGTYRALASSFARVGVGGYRVALESCPVIAATADTGTQTYTLPAIPAGTCLRHPLGRTVGYRFLSIPVTAGQLLTIRVTSTDFTPVWEAFLNWDPYESGEEPAVGSGKVHHVIVNADGLVTIAIGGDTPTAAGQFSVTLTHTGPAGPSAPRAARTKSLAR